jgi:hypothetical protein
VAMTSAPNNPKNVLKLPEIIMEINDLREVRPWPRATKPRAVDGVQPHVCR